MRELEGLPILETADDLLAFIMKDPSDRLLDYRNHPSLTVASLSALGITLINQYVKVRGTERGSNLNHDGTLALVALKNFHASQSSTIPQDIMALCKAADDLAPGRLLSWTGYEGIYVLATHPDAEVGEADWFSAVGPISTIKG